MQKGGKGVQVFAAFFVFIIFCIHIFAYKETIIDESYISFRYARNWAEGYGPVFNHGERVEGYTNFLTVVFLTAQYKLFPSLDTLLFVKAIGILSAFLQLLLSFALARLLFREKKFFLWLTALFLACDGTFMFGAVNGLETQFFALFVTAAIYFDLKEGLNTTGFTSTMFYFLSFLTRPDGIVFFVLSRLFKFAKNLRAGKKLPQKFFITCALFVFFAAVYVFSKYLFYGNIVPNTFFAKTGYETASRYIQGLFYVLLFLRDHPVSFILFLIFVPLFLKTGEAKFLLFIFSGFTSYLIYVGGDWLQGSRFFVPLLPVFYVLIVYGLHQFFEEGEKKSLAYVKVFVSFWVIAILCTQIYTSKATYAYAMDKTRGYKSAHIPLAIYLKNTLPENATLAIMDIGIVGYYTNMRIVDIMGLTDSYIAHSSGGENFLKRTYPVDYIFSKKPDCIILANAKEEGNLTGSFLIPMEEHIYASPEFQRNFRHVKTYFHRKNYYLHVYLKAGMRQQAIENNVDG